MKFLVFPFAPLHNALWCAIELHAFENIRSCENVTTIIVTASTAGEHESLAVWISRMFCREACGDRVEVLVFAGARLCCRNGGEIAPWLRAPRRTKSRTLGVLGLRHQPCSIADVRSLPTGQHLELGPGDLQFGFRRAKARAKALGFNKQITKALMTTVGAGMDVRNFVFPKSECF